MTGGTSEWLRVHRSRWAGRVRRGEEQVLDRLLSHAPSSIRSCALATLNEKAFRTVFTMPWGAGTAVVKHYRAFGSSRGLARALGFARHLVRHSPAIREWKKAVWLERDGVSVPRPLAYAEWRHGPFYGDSLYCVEVPDGGMDLREYIIQHPAGGGPIRERRSAVRSVARFLRGLHDERFSLGDCRWRNFIVQEAGGTVRCYLVDYEMVRRLSHVPLNRRVAELGQMQRSLSRRIPASECYRFLEAYFRAGRGLPISRRALWAAVVERADVLRAEEAAAVRRRGGP